MLRALLSQLVCPDALLGTPPADGLVSLSKIARIGCLRGGLAPPGSSARAAPDRRDRSRRRPRGPGAAGRPSKREGGNLLSAGDAADDAIVEEPS